MTTQGGATDFSLLIEVCQSVGPYCLIGGLAVNCYVEPVYTLDAELVTTPMNDSRVNARFERVRSTSDLRMQFTTDERYQPFLDRAIEAEVLGVQVRVASLADVTQGKLWAYSDPQHRLSKRKKDELDLIRLAESYPELIALYPAELASQIEP